MTAMTTRRRCLPLFTLMLLWLAAAMAQPRYNLDTMMRERLNRGVIALRTADGKAVVSWRLLTADKAGTAFEVYRNGKLLTPSPITEGGTFFTDESPLATDATYEVRGGSTNGSFTLKAGAPVGYLPIPLDKPEGGFTPDGRRFTYSANDASVGDVDGDGQYEVILKWEPSNAHDNAHDGFTGNTLFDCYRLDGTRLWRIDMGPNIRSGAHYVPFIVYDLDGDGRAELLVRTADGTTDSKGSVIGDATADWRIGAKEAKPYFEENKKKALAEAAEREKMRRQWMQMQRDGKRPERPRRDRRPRQMSWPGMVRNTGRIIEGKDYLSVFNGLTGEAMATVDFIPQRGDTREWGDDRANRSDRFLGGVGYFDGHRPSAFISRGYYGRTVVAVWDWDGKRLTNRWTFDTDRPELKAYAGQGNHNLRVADVDGDGCDEITFGSMAIDHDGTGLYTTGMGHGDAMHLTAFDPSTDRLQLWDCHENRRDGSDFRDAATGKVIFQIKSGDDVGRCMAADIDPTNPGLEMWSSDSHGIRTIKGDVLPIPKEASAGGRGSGHQGSPGGTGDNTALYIRGMRLPTNSAVWWDGDLLREMLDHERITKYDWTTGRCNLLLNFDGCQFNNGTKSNACLSGDIIGDWREEVLTRTADSRELRLYSTPIPTRHRITCLMEDIPYRLSVATENVGYNQPPHVGFYLGER